MNLTLLAGLNTDPITARGAVILSNIGLLAVVGTLGYGVFLWAFSRGRLLSMGSLSGLAVVAAVFVGQCLLAGWLRGDDRFAFYGVMFLFLIGMWLASGVVWALHPTWEWMLISIAWNAGMCLPVMLSFVWLSRA